MPNVTRDLLNKIESKQYLYMYMQDSTCNKYFNLIGQHQVDSHRLLACTTYPDNNKQGNKDALSSFLKTKHGI